jgi:co-chaperonin GroES (HSP10)
MRPINGRIIVKRKGGLNQTIQVGDFELILDPKFREYHNAVQVAEVIASDPESDTEPGDRVYVHHFVQSKEHRMPVEGEVSWLERGQVFCRVRNSKVKALVNYIFVEPVTYADVKSLHKNNMGFQMTIKGETDYVDRIGRVKYLSDMAQNSGLSVGDYVLFGKDCEYDIRVEDELLYRMELRDVITVIDELDKLQKVV